MWFKDIYSKYLSDLHLGDIVVTSITQYEEPSDQSPPSTAEGVVAAVEALPATVKVREAPGIKQSSPPLTVLVEPRHRSSKDIFGEPFRGFSLFVYVVEIVI